MPIKIVCIISMNLYLLVATSFLMIITLQMTCKLPGWSSRRTLRSLKRFISIDGVAAYFKKMKEVKVDFSKMRAPRDTNMEWKKWTPGRQVIF